MNYITAWINAGWSEWTTFKNFRNGRLSRTKTANDFMTYVNLVYLVLLTNRTAVLGPFAPSHIGGSAGIIPLGEVFDVPRLNKLLNHPVVEWRDVKMANVTDDTPREPIGCWSAWAAAEREGRPRGTPLDNVLKLGEWFIVILWQYFCVFFSHVRVQSCFSFQICPTRLLPNTPS